MDRLVEYFTKYHHSRTTPCGNTSCWACQIIKALKKAKLLGKMPTYRAIIT